MQARLITFLTSGSGWKCESPARLQYRGTGHA